MANIFFFVNIKHVFFLLTVFFISINSFPSDLSSIKEVLNGAYFKDIRNNTSIIQTRASILSKVASYEDLLRACQESKISTDKFCFEGNDKGINQFSSMMGSLTDVGSMAMSASCSKLADILKYGQGALLAFRGTCSVKKSDCVEKCSQAEKTIAAIKRDMNNLNVTFNQSKESIIKQSTGNVTTQTEIPKGSDNNCHISNSCEEPANDNVSLNEKLKKADKLADDGSAVEAFNNSAVEIQKAINDLDNLNSNNIAESPSMLRKACEATQAEATGKAVMNLSSLTMTMQKNTACAKDFANLDTGLNLADCNLTGTCTTTPTPNECQDPQFKDSIYCKTPTTTSLDSRGSGGGMASTKPTTPDFNLNTGNLKGLNMDGLGGGGADGPGGPGSIPDTPGPKSAGVPGGSGGGGLSIPGAGGAAPNKGGGSRGVSSDGTNYGASPGYAGGTASIGGGSGDKNKDDLQQYLPGGAKDPNLAKAGGPEGITAAGGPTIFEKVTRGYKNSRSTLIPE